MDLLRPLLIMALLLLMSVSVVSATPADVTWDLLYAVEYGRGDDFLELLSESVRLQIEDTFQQLREISYDDPGLAETLLERTGSGITAWDLEWMTVEDFVSRLLLAVPLPSLEEVISEDVSMHGRNAEVTFTWFSGTFITFSYTWENSSWKLTGSSLLAELF